MDVTGPLLAACEATTIAMPSYLGWRWPIAGLRIERSRVPIPVAAEIYFSSECTKPYPKNLAQVLLGVSSSFPVNQYTKNKKLYIYINGQSK